MTTTPIELAATVERQRDEIREGFRLTINRASRENASNTHDFVLADFLMRCLEAFEESTRLREHLRSPAPSPAETEAVPVEGIRRLLSFYDNDGMCGLTEEHVNTVRAWLATQAGTR